MFSKAETFLIGYNAFLLWLLVDHQIEDWPVPLCTYRSVCLRQRYIALQRASIQCEILDSLLLTKNIRCFAVQSIRQDTETTEHAGYSQLDNDKLMLLSISWGVNTRATRNHPLFETTQDCYHTIFTTNTIRPRLQYALMLDVRIYSMFVQAKQGDERWRNRCPRYSLKKWCDILSTFVSPLIILKEFIT